MSQIDQNSGTPEPIILALETSGSSGSVAISIGMTLLGEEPLSTSARHAADLLPAIDRLCKRCTLTPSQIQHCYVSIGPGSFTGLRVAVTVARHLALATNARLVAVPTLDVIAEEARPHLAPGEHVVVILDAKRAQVFGAIYRHDPGRMTSLAHAQLVDPATFLSRAPHPCHVTGEGIQYHLDVVNHSALPCLPKEHRWPRARSVLALGWQRFQAGEFVDPHKLTPLYVRIPEAEEVWARRHAVVTPPTV